MNKFVNRGLLATGLVLTSIGCAEVGSSDKTSEAAQFETSDLYNNPHLEVILPGQSRLVIPETEDDITSALRSDLSLKDIQHENGFEDGSAPEISQEPTRVDAHVDIDPVDGDHDLDNDLTCDTLNIDLLKLDLDRVRLGALILGSRDSEQVLVSWPTDEAGDPSEQFYMCMADGVEPAHGVVFFISDQLR